MAALTYYLRKYLKFICKKNIAQVAAMEKGFQNALQSMIFWLYRKAFEPSKNYATQFLDKNESLAKTRLTMPNFSLLKLLRKLCNGYQCCV
jgi:hypothetical protein